MTSKDNSEVFRISYTNRDIMSKLSNIHNDINLLKTAQAVTNGRVKTHERLLWSLGSMFVLIIGFLIYNNPF